MNDDIIASQQDICVKYGTLMVPCTNGVTIGVSRGLRSEVLPINGVRVAPQGDSSGWFIWSGDWSDDPAFFVPLHVEHLAHWCPLAVPFLLLPPGWRFQVAPGHEDAWLDPDVKAE